MRTMKTPVQVWSPFLCVSPMDEAYTRDLQRAQQEWRGEKYVWLMPGADRVVRWAKKSGPLYHLECIIPAEAFNLITVIHVDENRHVFPHVRCEHFPDNRLPEALYTKWLQTNPG